MTMRTKRRRSRVGDPEIDILDMTLGKSVPAEELNHKDGCGGYVCSPRLGPS